VSSRTERPDLREDRELLGLLLGSIVVERIEVREQLVVGGRAGMASRSRCLSGKDVARCETAITNPASMPWSEALVDVVHPAVRLRDRRPPERRFRKLLSNGSPVR